MVQQVPFNQARKEVTYTPKLYKNASLAAVLIGIVVIVQVLISRLHENVGGLLIFISVFILMGGYFYRQYRLEISNIAMLQRFASANNAKLLLGASAESYSGALFHDGHTREIVMALEVSDDEPMEIGNYRYVTGHGRSARTHTFTYIRIKLDVAVPHIFIDSTSNNHWWYREHASQFASNQELKFEGDFSDHFRVLVPDEYGRDATYILTPDVLQALLQFGKEFDFELVDNELCMFKRGQVNLADEMQLKTLFAKAGMFAKAFRKQTKRYTDERMAEQSVKAVAPGGQRLRTAIPWLLVALASYFIVSILIQTFIW